MDRRMRKFGLLLLMTIALSASAQTYTTATLTVTGSETQRADQSWDVGPFQVAVTVGTYTMMETVYYGQYSSPASVAAQIAGEFTRDYLQNGLSAYVSWNTPINPASPTTVTFKLLASGASFGMLGVSGPTGSFQLNGTGFGAYNWTAPGSGTGVSTVYMTGGQDAGTYYDTGTVSVRVSGAVASADWTEGSTPSGLASELASGINTAAGSFVSASASGATVSVTSLGGGAAADMTILGTATDTGSPNFSSPSFSVATTDMSGGTSTEGSLLYGFTVPDNGGYDLNGNVVSSWDSVMGSWSYAYDNLNRLTSASATASGAQANFTGALPTWSYDAFGNRTAETWGGSGSYTVPANTSANFTAGINQMTGAQYTYDAAGDVTYDGLNNYLYDAEGRICAVKNSYGAMTGYIYDAGGIRVARGSLNATQSNPNPFTCDFNPAHASTYNGFQTTTSWVLGPGGEQVTEYSVSGGASTWVHTNAFASGALLATYTSSNNDTIFNLEDWLGTKRAEIGASGCFTVYTSMPYGNGLTPVSVSGYTSCADATEHHFTNKERDPESGNDYFEARYYSSTMGRFMSPDWSAKEDPVPYANLEDPQSLNLYAYVRNNPVLRADPDGHCCEWAKQKIRQAQSWADAHPRTVMGLKAAGAAVVTVAAVATLVATAPVSVPATLGAAAVSALSTTAVGIGGAGAAVATVTYTYGAITGDKSAGDAADKVGTLANPAGMAVAIGSGGNLEKAEKAAAVYDLVSGGKDLLAHPDEAVQATGKGATTAVRAGGAAAATSAAASLVPEPKKDKNK